MRTVRSFAGESQEVRRYKSKMVEVYKLNKKEAFVYAGYVWSNSVNIFENNLPKNFADFQSIFY